MIRRWFRRLRFLPHLVAKSVVLIAVMYVAFAVLNVLDVMVDGVSWADYRRTLMSNEVLVGLLIALGVISFLLFFVHLDRLLGPGVLVGYLAGRYHHPRQEERIFMFLDLKGSTTLAERMEDTAYFAFLQRYFAEMSEPILETDAEIYQYVGDEVVLTWPLDRGLQEFACVRAFFLIERHLADRREEFLEAFGVAPEFKAGLHAGSVVAAQDRRAEKRNRVQRRRPEHDRPHSGAVQLPRTPLSGIGTAGAQARPGVGVLAGVARPPLPCAGRTRPWSSSRSTGPAGPQPKPDRWAARQKRRRLRTLRTSAAADRRCSLRPT